MKPMLMLAIAWIGTVPDALGAEAVIAEREAKLVRLRELAQDRRWRDIVQQFAQDDFAAWPAENARQASEALTQRGLAYSFLKEGQRAAADLHAATKLDPQNALAWMTLGDNYANNLNDERAGAGRLPPIACHHRHDQRLAAAEHDVVDRAHPDRSSEDRRCARRAPAL